LSHALRAGALCALVRTYSWRPDGTVVKGCRTNGISSTSMGTPLRGHLQISNPQEVWASATLGINL
jgi:hypothetical protein